MKEKLTHWKVFHNPDYLGAYALAPGEELVATFKSVGMEQVAGVSGKKEECMVAHFAEQGVKPMVLNATNCKTIAKMYGTPYVEQWAGRRIQVYATEVQAFGDTVEALRVRPREPQATKPELNPQHPRWKEALKSFQTGSASMEWIKKNYVLSPENEALFVEEAPNA